MHNPKLAAVHKQSAVERLFSKEAAEAVPLRDPAEALSGGKGEEEEDNPLERKCYLILRGWRRPLAKLRLISRQGEAVLVDYGSITWVNLRPNGNLELRVNDGEPYTVTLSGRRLSGELLDGLQREHVEWICELEELAAAKAAKDEPEAGVVTGIFIKEGSVSREWSLPARPGAAHP
jgi:hypothetical protein